MWSWLAIGRVLCSFVGKICPQWGIGGFLCSFVGEMSPVGSCPRTMLWTFLFCSACFEKHVYDYKNFNQYFEAPQATIRGIEGRRMIALALWRNDTLD